MKKLKDLFKPKDEGSDDPIDAIERFLPGRFPFGRGEERIKKYEKFLNGLSSKSNIKILLNLFLKTLKIEKGIFIKIIGFSMIMIYLLSQKKRRIFKKN